MNLKIKLALSGIVISALALSAAAAQAMQIDVLVDKVSQHMHVSVDGVQKYDWLVSTGGQGFDTPSGNYHIFRMEKEHFSVEWDNAPMPYSMFFTGIGHAIHGSYHVKALGTRASHGCVRLAPENAAVLWGLITKAGFKNNTVVIKGGFFDPGEKLTTEKTFHMQPKEHLTSLASNQLHSPFWWQKPIAKPQAKKLADATKPDVKGKKKKKKIKGLFDLTGGQQG